MFRVLFSCGISLVVAGTASGQIQPVPPHANDAPQRKVAEQAFLHAVEAIEGAMADAQSTADKAIVRSEQLALRERVLTLLKAAQTIQSRYVDIRERVNAIPGLALVAMAPPETQQQVLTICERIDSVISHWELIGDRDKLQTVAGPWQKDVLPVAHTTLDCSRPGGGFGGGLGGGGGFGDGDVPGGSDPGGGGGGVCMADFQPLIDLIESTVTWEPGDEVGLGGHTIGDYDQNLSLVIRQTQEVHDAIRDLLETLRQLQNLQVTVEVRFINVQDSFFEQIGVDFQQPTQSPAIRAQIGGVIPSTGVLNQAYKSGFQQSVSLCVPLEQTTSGVRPYVGVQFENQSWKPASFQVNTTGRNLGPQGHLNLTGGSAVAGVEVSAATFGFAILSDIEAFFFIQAAGGGGQANQRLQNLTFNPAITTFVLPTNNVETSTSYLNGEFTFGVGASTPAGVSVSGNITYQALRTDLFFGDGRTSGSTRLGLEIATTTDALLEFLRNRRN